MIFYKKNTRRTVPCTHNKNLTQRRINLTTTTKQANTFNKFEGNIVKTTNAKCQIRKYLKVGYDKQNLIEKRILKNEFKFHLEII